MMKKQLKVVELFAGVGGFRLGLDKCRTNGVKYRTIWSNQWEPGQRQQHASKIYIKRFGSSGHSNQDISKVSTKEIPNHNLLVAGFPCQDYSVARTLSHAEGLKGKKGVLWWEIYRILKEKKEYKPEYLLLENVDRLLKSPAPQRGRDFAIMLSSLSVLGYAVEWRVINAADYGMPQRRRRVYILAYRRDTNLYKNALATEESDWVYKKGVMARAFKIRNTFVSSSFKIERNLSNISDNFNKNGKRSPFDTAGFMINHKIWTCKAEPIKEKGMTLNDVLIRDVRSIPREFFVPSKDLLLWKKHKGAKKEKRTTKDGFTYTYSEGGMVFPDALDKASRTIVTGEGGPTPSRFKHVIKTRTGKLRRLMPIELERLNMFPDNHTNGASDSMRAFFMGNALVVNVVTRIGNALAKEL